MTLIYPLELTERQHRVALAALMRYLGPTATDRVIADDLVQTLSATEPVRIVGTEKKETNDHE